MSDGPEIETTTADALPPETGQAKRTGGRGRAATAGMAAETGQAAPPETTPAARTAQTTTNETAPMSEAVRTSAEVAGMAQLANDAAEDRQFPLRACHQAITMAHEYAQTTLHTCENAVGSHFDLMQTWMSSSNSWGQNCQRIADTIVSMQKTLLQQMSEQGKLLPGLWMQMGAKALAPLQADPAKN